MQNSLKIATSEAAQRLLDLIGGEALDGSGFESEQTELTFVANQIEELPEPEA